VWWGAVSSSELCWLGRRIRLTLSGVVFSRYETSSNGDCQANCQHASLIVKHYQTIFKDSKGRWRDDVLWKTVPYTWRSNRKWPITHGRKTSSTNDQYIWRCRAKSALHYGISFSCMTKFINEIWRLMLIVHIWTQVLRVWSQSVPLPSASEVDVLSDCDISQVHQC